MYEIIFYEDKNGKSEVADWIRDFKIVSYFNQLEKMGTRVGAPVTKHLEGEIWELRPFENRILYAYFQDNKFIILSHFVKKTRKTPRRELEKAKRNLQDFQERNV